MMAIRCNLAIIKENYLFYFAFIFTINYTYFYVSLQFGAVTLSSSLGLIYMIRFYISYIYILPFIITYVLFRFLSLNVVPLLLFYELSKSLIVTLSGDLSDQ